ncbi:hypothetical protein K1719_002528 [Acacia pycnantha]|nr:hypothetical protein K1719_002528 [Acacia pycnantha]
MDAITYLKAVKTTFDDDNETERYNMFVAILKDLKNQRSDVAGFLTRMKEILRGHDFLILGLNVFMPKGYEITLSYEDQPCNGQKRQRNEKALNNVKNVNKFKKPKMNETKPVQEIGINKGKRCHNYKNRINDHNDINKNNRKNGDLIPREVDLNKCERYGSSYVCLPEDYKSPLASWRSELEVSVLNDRFVLNPCQGDHQDSLKSKKMFNKSQEALFKVEEEQFEADMLLESLKSACKHFKEVYQNILENVEGSLRIEDCFTALHLRWIEHMYGEHGLEALEALRNNPTVAVPLMLGRLEGKLEELKPIHLELKKVWAQVYADDHAKSLAFPAKRV